MSGPKMDDFGVALRTLTVSRRPPSGGWPTLRGAPTCTEDTCCTRAGCSQEVQQWVLGQGGGLTEQDGLRHCWPQAAAVQDLLSKVGSKKDFIDKNTPVLPLVG